MFRFKALNFLHLTNKTKLKPKSNLLIHSFNTLISAIKQEEEKAKHLLSLSLENSTIHQSTQQIHSHLLTNGLFINSMLLFNILLRCYSLTTSPHLAFLLYNQLQLLYFHSPLLSPFVFDSFTYTFLLNACANAFCPRVGSQLHSLIIKVGFRSHIYVHTALVNMYVSSGILCNARLAFDEMPERNSVTWNVMITGLVKLGELEFAVSLFDEMPEKNVVSWTGIIDGYVRMEKYGESLGLFRRMVSLEGIRPSEITILAILPAISNMRELKNCGLIHGYVEKRGFNKSDIRVANSIIDTYAKCGCIESASRFFEEISAERKNLVSWTSIISGFAMYGMGNEAVEIFERMEKTGVKPNRVTFLSVLNACSHGGLVEEGYMLFEKMVNEYSILPDIKHYGCLIDMLGRTGRLEEAEKLALRIPSEIANVVIWRTLLGACSFHGDIEMGERVTRMIMEMERGYGGDYVLMHNIFSGAGRFKDAERLRILMDERNAFKLSGHSSV
ncbi:pentatricopeptide repeat-containing protein At1g09220, mitochondrial [Mercurialis annua]|uniref:pentatricopeptide repeat-containing protein At1g09220, mitochondrial n=1 Tax=Mercurialis annua TaxID=3986 RepID=UPI0021603B75|nr:pentatricopeptide repeat-containing protein At1g09220, mitochondrial [Mercurialis annua]XP_050224623.1 pentatricopeptide repeat-containing protein At1g09220, mitochondrial [Mercurialis annua]